MHTKNIKQFEQQLKTSGFTFVEPFHENEKGGEVARIMNEKGEQLFVTILPLQEEQREHTPQYKFQLLGSEKGGENTGKTFTLEHGELEKGLPLIQKNPNQALKLKANGWNFAAPLAGIIPREMLKIDGIQGDEELTKEPYEAVRRGGSDEVDEVVHDFQHFPGAQSGLTANTLAGALPEILPMPPAGTTKNLTKQIIGKNLADEQAISKEAQKAEEQIMKTMGGQIAQQIGKLPTLKEIMKRPSPKKSYSPNISQGIRIKVPVGEVGEREKTATIDKLRGEIRIPQLGQGEADQAQGSRQEEEIARNFRQPQEEEIPLIPFSQKGKSKKSRLLKYIAGGAISTGVIGIAGSGLFPIFFG